MESPTGQWTDMQNYSTNNTFTLATPSAGDYLVAVEVMDQAQVAAGDWSMAQTTLPDGVFNGSTLSVMSNANGSVAKGQTVTLTATESNVFSPLYQFWYQQPDGTWVQSGNYQSRNTFTFTASQAGTYKYVAYVKSPLAANNPHGALESHVGSQVAYGTASQVVLSLASPTVVANGSATDLLTATVEDRHGNRVANFSGTLNIAATGSELINGGSTTVMITNGMGVLPLGTSGDTSDDNNSYTVTSDNLISAATAAGGTAGQGQVANVTYGSATVMTTAPSDNGLGLQSMLPNLESNAQSSTTVWVQLKDSTGAPYTTVGGQDVTLTLGGSASGSFSSARIDTTDTIRVPGGASEVPVTVYSEPGSNGTLTVTAQSTDPSVTPLSAASISIPVVEVGRATAVSVRQVGSTSGATVYAADVVDAGGNTISLGSGAAGTFALTDNTGGTSEEMNYFTVAETTGGIDLTSAGVGPSPAGLSAVKTLDGQVEFAVATVHSGLGTPATITATDTATTPPLAGTTMWTFATPAPGYAEISPLLNGAVYANSATGYNVTAGQTVTVSAQLTTQYGEPVALAGQPIWFQIAEAGGATAALPNGAGQSGDQYQAVTNAAGIATVTVTVPADAAPNTRFSLTVFGTQDVHPLGPVPAPIASNMTTPTYWTTPASSYATALTLDTASASASIAGVRQNGWTWPSTKQFPGGMTISDLALQATNALSGSVVGHDGGLWAALGGDSLLVTSSNPAVASLSASYGYLGTATPVGTANNAWVVVPYRWSASSGAPLPNLHLNKAGTAMLTITDLSNPTVATTRIVVTVTPGTATAQPAIWYQDHLVNGSNPVPVSSPGRVELSVVNVDAGGNPVPVVGAPLVVDLPNLPSQSGLQWSDSAGGISAASGMTATVAAGSSSANVWLVSDGASSTWTGNTTSGGFALDRTVAQGQASQTLYVSPSGSDSNNGSQSAPYRTIGAAVSAASAGDTVVVEPGTYDVTTPINIGEPLTVTSETGQYASGSAVVTGAGPIFYLQNLSNGSVGVSGVTIAGLSFSHITNAGANGVITVGGYGAADVQILNNQFDNTATEAIGYHGNAGLPAPLGTGFLIQGNTIDNVTGSQQTGIWLGNLSNSAVVDNTVKGTTWAGIIDTGASQGDTQNMVIADNQVSQVPHEGIQVAYGDHISVLDNTVTEAGQDGPSAPTTSMDAAISLFNTDQNNLFVAGNNLTNNFQGIELGQESAPSSRGAVGSNVDIVRNNITGNTQAVVNLSSSGTLNAVGNWWGSAAGPASGQVSGSVDYFPWLTHPMP